MIDKKSPWPYPFVDLFPRETIFEMQLKFLYILDFVSKTFPLFYSVKIKNIIMFYNTIFLQSLIFLSQ